MSFSTGLWCLGIIYQHFLVNLQGHLANPSEVINPSEVMLQIERSSSFCKAVNITIPICSVYLFVYLLSVTITVHSNCVNLLATTSVFLCNQKPR